jgi:CTP synthase
LIVRSERSAGDEATSIIEKLSTFTAIKPDGIALLPNARTVYEVPLSLESAGIPDYVTKKLKVKTKQPKLTEWKKLVATAINDDLPKRSIAVVAKYMSNEDTYMSVFEALRAAGWAEQVQADITWVDAEHVTDDNVDELLSGFDGIVIPGGFGTRGLEGKISAASFAAREKMPYLGLCLGMQMAVVALAREAVDPLATSLEIDENAKIPVINLMSDQKGITAKGGTMRLGNYPCVLQKGSLARKLYGSDHVAERHRHRFEFNNDYREKLEAAGMVFSGLSPDGKLVEIVELPDHPFYIASQFHPEFRSRPNHPHPLFLGFVAAVCKRATIRK